MVLAMGDPPHARNIAFRTSDRYYTTAPGSLPVEEWTHVAFVKKGATGTSYVNGKVSGGPHDLSELADLTNARPLLIGRRLHEPTPALVPEAGIPSTHWLTMGLGGSESAAP